VDHELLLLALVFLGQDEGEGTATAAARRNVKRNFFISCFS